MHTKIFLTNKIVYIFINNLFTIYIFCKLLIIQIIYFNNKNKNIMFHVKHNTHIYQKKFENSL